MIKPFYLYVSLISKVDDNTAFRIFTEGENFYNHDIKSLTLNSFNYFFRKNLLYDFLPIDSPKFDSLRDEIIEKYQQYLMKYIPTWVNMDQGYIEVVAQTDYFEPVARSTIKKLFGGV